MLRRWSCRHNAAPGERRVYGDVLEQEDFVGCCRDHAHHAPVDFRDDHAVLRDDLVAVHRHGTGLRADDGDPAIAGGHDAGGEGRRIASSRAANGSLPEDHGRTSRCRRTVRVSGERAKRCPLRGGAGFGP